MGSNDKVKQRRNERLRSIRESSEAAHRQSYGLGPVRLPEYLAPPREPDVPLYADAEWRRKMEDPEFAWKQKQLMDRQIYRNGGDEDDTGLLRPPSPRKIAIKLLISAALFGTVYGMFQLQQPWAEKGKRYVSAALTESYDFTAISAWYADTFGGSPSFIPSWNRTGSEAIKVSTSKRTLYVPAKGTIIVPYDGNSHKGVNVSTQEFAPVYALDTGQVIFAGKTPDTGMTVVIRHPGGLQSTYGGLSEVSVAAGDWMKVGEPIGKASERNAAKGTMYFALTKEGLPINPTDVISFD
ncbi:M23 family metallopeptidase [Paenibacillus oryzisoli]|uniref:peptidoglycan DD-metalloendopeptidase family protein n=1 Tax=Paenibacillus oryzisoli TaxID=1850517 RepID=UPI003D2E2512